MDFAKLRHIIFFAFLTLTTVAFLYMIMPFAYPIFWAAVIAGIFYPLYRKFVTVLKGRNLGAILTLIVVFFIIIIPLLSIGTLLATELRNLYDEIAKNQDQISISISNFANVVKNSPYAATLHIDQQFWTDKFRTGAQYITDYTLTNITSLTKNTFIFLGMFLIMFYSLFFFLRDGKKMLLSLMHMCPLGDKYEKVLYEKFTSTARATLKGTIIVGSIQGALGGFLFYVTGIQGAFIWGIAMAVLSIIPPLSSAVVWFPAGAIMLLSGNIWQGVLILAFGVTVVSTIDNLLKPLLVGKDAQMHPLIVLFSTLGGIILFKISGFIIGPIIASLFIAFWQMYDEYYRDELSNNVK